MPKRSPAALLLLVIACLGPRPSSVSPRGPISVIQTKNGNFPESGSPQISFTSLPAVGRTIIVNLDVWQGGAGGRYVPAQGHVVDNQGHTYTLLYAVGFASCDPDGGAAHAFYKTVVTASSGTFTITFNNGLGSNGYSNIVLYELSTDANLSLGDSDSFCRVSQPPDPIRWGPNALTVSSAPAIAFASVSWRDGGLSTPVTTPSGWTVGFHQPINRTQDISAVYKILSDTTSQTPQWEAFWKGGDENFHGIHAGGIIVTGDGGAAPRK